MSKRKTVQLNLDFTQKRIKEKCRSNVVFSERMGRPQQKTWVTEWGRGRNLPSPEEAAQMCVVLEVRPEDILTDPEDIAHVQDLLDSQKENAAPEPGSGITDKDIRVLKWFNSLPPETRKAILTLGGGPEDLGE